MDELLGYGPAAYLAVRTADRLFGPSADEVAEALRRWTASRVGDVQRVVENAGEKVQEGSKGHVPFRLSMHVLEEGSYTDDAVVVEYLGGVLASSLTDDERDDRGIAYASLITRMSSYQLRLHFVIHRTLREALRGADFHVYDVHKDSLLIPWDSLPRAMVIDLPPEGLLSVMSHSLYGLEREALVFNNWAVGDSVDKLAARWGQELPSPGLIASGTQGGVDLYLWGLGAGKSGVNAFGNPMIEAEPKDIDVSIPKAWVRRGDQVLEFADL